MFTHIYEEIEALQEDAIVNRSGLEERCDLFVIATDAQRQPSLHVASSDYVPVVLKIIPLF